MSFFIEPMCMDNSHPLITSEFPVSDITLSGVWYSSIFVVLFFALLLMAPCIHATFHDNDKARWKRFWNWTELVWIGVAGLSIFTAISSAWLPTRTVYVSALMRMANENFADATRLSKALLADHCDQNDQRTACVVLKKIPELSNLEDFKATGALWNEFTLATRELEPGDPIRVNRGNIMFTLAEARDAAREAAYERGRQFSTDGITEWLRYLWPHIFAFGFGIRFSRGIAAFAL